MKVLLVEHPKKLWPLFGNGVVQPIHLAYLAAVLEENGIDVDILDCTVLGYGWEEYERFLEKTHPDIVGVSGITPFLSSAVKTVQIAKKVIPEVVTVVGGTHFTLNAEQALLRYPDIDYVVRGEGEITLLELVKALDNHTKLSDVKGIGFREKNSIIMTEERPLIEDLDTLPMPAYHKLPMDKYRFIFWGSEVCVVIGSRGCPFQCRFCTERLIWRNRWRGRSASKVVDEMELLNKKYGVRIIWFGDDCFNLNRERTEQFVNELEERELDMKWYIETRVDTLLRDADLVPKMARLGLFHVLLGAESSSENDLKYLSKGIEPQDTKKAVDLLKNNNIIAHTNFILGLPTDSKQSIRNTVNFAKSIDPDMAVFVAFTPFPGTDLYDEIVKLGLLKEKNFENFDFIKPVASTNSLSQKQVQREIILAFARFYARPTKLVQSLLNRNEMTRKTFIHVFRFMSTYMIERFFKNELATE